MDLVKGAKNVSQVLMIERKEKREERWGGSKSPTLLFVERDGRSMEKRIGLLQIYMVKVMSVQ